MERVVVTTATKLSADLRKEVEEIVAKKLGHKDFSLEEKVDANVLGGISIMIGSRAYDATLRGKLNAFTNN